MGMKNSKEAIYNTYYYPSSFGNPKQDSEEQKLKEKYNKSGFSSNPLTSAATSPFLSPVTTSDPILAQFPKTRIMLSNIDPLRDEGLKFAQRLSSNKADVKVIEYQFLPHGFLNMNTKTYDIQDENNQTLQQCIRWIQEMIANPKEPKPTPKSHFFNFQF